MLSAITKTPELALAEPEADALAKALDTVNQYYRVEVAEKTVAWINLSATAAMIYGTRIVAIRMRHASERADKAKPINPQKATPGAENERQKPENVATTADAYSGIPDDYMPGAFPGMGPTIA